ncbi:hypothetical protein PC129_g4902 [Phytophthora cactorum]|uniref:Uncharacterized protein n=1 Tax=Phytophthora cactorum TaxID=29920 RepID=A0A329SDC0_9STRA|nr:hypothetical protein Pcac1_g1835 [Phytophthora cactorum]KAG2791757.1 hypothetical protein PC111_g23771 [Phytophthora cactorum]KAG2861730.1 hypothetical protein PC113_g6907 [Phytophthora cactorum]KAG2872072.1 hypothetical protein PC114_g26580 [Phytophthora cactorum]KAG2881162.1 hypothetical protein PC117_g26441 [Phytophthora cactorum]
MIVTGLPRGDRVGGVDSVFQPLSDMAVVSNVGDGFAYLSGSDSFISTSDWASWSPLASVSGWLAAVSVALPPPNRGSSGSFVESAVCVGGLCWYHSGGKVGSSDVRLH